MSDEPKPIGTRENSIIIKNNGSLAGALDELIGGGKNTATGHATLVGTRENPIGVKPGQTMGDAIRVLPKVILTVS